MNSNFDRNFNIIQKLVFGFIGFVFILITVGFILFGYLAYKSADVVQEIGLRGAIQQIWCGEKKECILKGGIK